MSDGGETGDAMNPTFLRTDFQNMQKMNTRDNFTCPQMHFTFDDGHVNLDPSYYGYRYCVCDDGHYGSHGICHKCMSGAVCKKPKVDSWKDLNKSVMIMNEGFWPMPKPENVSHLRKCFSPKACNPSGDCSCSGIGITRLNQLTHCNSRCLCSHGNTGRFCSRCFEGFYKSGQICIECAEDRPKLYISLLSLIVSMLILWWAFSDSGFYPLTAYAALAIQEGLMIILVFLGFLPGWAFGLNLLIFVFYITSKRKELHALIKIATFYVQLLDCMISSSNIWPEKVLSTQHYFSALWNLHFTDLSCDFTILFTPVGKFLSILFLPIACIILTWLYYAAKTIYQKCRAASRDSRTQGIELKFKCRRITIMILNFTYFPIVTATISALTPCEKDSGISYMPSIPWVECSSGIYNTLFFLGWASLLLYVVSVPYFIFFPVLLRNRKIIGDEKAAEHQNLEKWLGTLYSTYNKSCRWYYELLLLTRRLILAFILSFLKVYLTWQTLLVCCVLTIALVVHLVLKPYMSTNARFPFGNTIETVVLAVLLNSFAALTFINCDPISLMPIVWLVIGANAIVILGIILSAVFLTIYSSRSSQWYERL